MNSGENIMLLYILIQLLLFSSVAGKFEKIEIVPKIPNYIQHGSNVRCRQESRTYTENLKNLTSWAHKMLDSSAKNPFGILRGNSYQLGNFKECINVVGPFSTQYCLISLIINAPIQNASMSYHGLQKNPYGSMYTKLQKPRHGLVQQNNNLRIGLCLPASCPAEDIEYSLMEHLKRSKNPFEHNGPTYTLSASDDLCSSNFKPNEFGSLEIFFCAISAVLILLVILGTVTNDSDRKNAKKWDKFHLRRKFCLSFSAIKTWNNLFCPHEANEETKIFDSVRTVMLLLIIIAHKIQCVSFGPWINPEVYLKMANTKLSYLLEQADLAVNTFFLMSGLLLSYGTLKKMKNSKVNPILSIVLRYVRLTPLNAYVSLFMMTMINFCGSGPVWNIILGPQIKNCRQNIWTNLLHINTFVTSVDELCNPVTWFISADFQLFIVGTLTMFVIKCNKRLGYSILGILFVLSIITPFTLTVVYKIQPIFGTEHDEQYRKYINLIYSKSYNHASTYIVGIFGGILYDHLKCNNVKISKVLSYFIIAISSFFMLFTVGYLAIFYDGYENYNAIEIALYNSLHRIIWTICVLGIFVVASFGPITSLRKSLSSTFWIPISKLCYGAFLIHIPLFLMSVGNTSTVINVTPFYMLSTLIADLVAILLISLFLYIFVETPIIKLFRFVFLPEYYRMEKSKERSTLKVLEDVQTENNVFIIRKNYVL